MKIRYYCRQCERQVGELDAKQADPAQLGSDLLNDTDDQQALTMHADDDGIDIQTICDACKEKETY
ncbi:anti-sigma-F factor Fin [Halobacillus sp. Marseille-Q1614]|uniref:anti-sigma-F factor Fin n=1 Tax=Halobacillus sp. Marseille-Q1614 TaxID=2709134 RepID=UPI00156FD1E3|nr:anti-sigma-F factor Fin [Halobacillus sp. Marseille-Q1614]